MPSDSNFAYKNVSTKIKFRTSYERIRLITEISENQSNRMFSVTDLKRNYKPVTNDPVINFSTGTVVIPLYI